MLSYLENREGPRNGKIENNKVAARIITGGGKIDGFLHVCPHSLTQIF